MAGLEGVTKRHQDLEFRVTDMLTQLAAEESALSENQRTPAPLKAFAKSQLTASQLGGTGTIEEQITPRLEALEQRLIGRLAFGVESMGELMKDQAKRMRSLTDRLKALEATFGAGKLSKAPK